MCYAIPGKVVEIIGNTAVVDYFGEIRKVRIDEFVNAYVGDYVYAQGGVIVQKIPDKEAISILEAWQEMFHELQGIDVKISKVASGVMLEKELRKIVTKIQRGMLLSKEEALRILKTDDEIELKYLFQVANRIRHMNLRNACCVHGIIEFSNYCRNNCLYCGIRKNNNNIQRYRMSVDEIIETAEYAVNELKFKALVLQSGEDTYYSDDMLVEIIREIRERCGVLLFMSVGSRSFKCYKNMFDAGARGILLRFETSNRNIYSAVHSGPKSDFDYRLSLIKHAKEIGYLVATGFLIGLPGQTEEDIVEDILLTKSFGVEMYSFGPFIPHPNTPLGSFSSPDIKLVLKTIALTRFLDPQAKIVVTTALETLDSEAAKAGLLAGANSLMINLTPQKYRKFYDIYPNRAGHEMEITECISKTVNLLYSLGRVPIDLGV